MLLLASFLVLLAAPQADPLGRLSVWVERARLAPRSVDPKHQQELRAILGDLRVRRAAERGERAAIDLVLVELASLQGRSGAYSEPTLVASANLARAELEAGLARGDEELGERLAREVLDAARKRPRAERLLAAQLLERARVPGSVDALRSAAREPDPELARAALAALCGWDEPGVHLFFLDELARDAPCTRAASEHFARTGAALGAPVLERLQHEVARRYLSEDWREAARARKLLRALDLPRAVPVLIEAVATWQRRTSAGTGSRRIVGEILDELRRISGRSYGPDAARWGDWWQGVRSGRIVLPDDGGAANVSSATFFGLHAFTDRVVIVVDGSGSMRQTFGTAGRSRHDEAIAQLERFLRQSGEDTRFTVALFDDRGSLWRARLAFARDANLALARRWLEERNPSGGTQLFEGLRAGLGLDEHGRFSPERCEADTVIVLCDGATSDGPGWVSRWLAEENERAQLVFHCVQIGDEGNGVLEALAEGSGGQFVRVQG